jgi:histidine ammonia-lyase
LLTGAPLTIAEVEAVARGGATVEIAPQGKARLRGSRDALEAAIRSGAAIYGVNTGFGSLAHTRIPDDSLREVQRNLIRSHSAGVGEPLPPEVVRGMLLLLAASLCRGHSGVRPETAAAVVATLNAGVTPVVPSVGSVGASGDLAPLAHAVLVLLGEGEATLGSAPERLPGAEALRRAGLQPISLTAKEGLALINGTHLMSAQGTLLCADAERLVAASVAASAMSIDACRGTDAFLDPAGPGAGGGGAPSVDRGERDRAEPSARRSAGAGPVLVAVRADRAGFRDGRAGVRARRHRARTGGGDGQSAGVPGRRG